MRVRGRGWKVYGLGLKGLRFSTQSGINGAWTLLRGCAQEERVQHESASLQGLYWLLGGVR